MQLWATGFNAWNQLNFQNDVEDSSLDANDIHSFKHVLTDENIDVLRTSLSSVLVKTSHGFLATGTPDDFKAHWIEKQNASSNVAIAFNNKIATCTDGTLTEYPNLEAYKARHDAPLRSIGDVQQVVANTATFTALTSLGTVYTWGDPRFEACLARKPSEEHPASQPHIVEDLVDLPTGNIRKLASGGYHTAALTIGNDLYLWGGRPGQAKMFDELEDYPTPVDVKENDWADVAVGQDHIVALSTEGDVWVIGEGGNGQLGLSANIPTLREWRKLKLDLDDLKVSKVYAGYKNSFLIIE